MVKTRKVCRSGGGDKEEKGREMKKGWKAGERLGKQ